MKGKILKIFGSGLGLVVVLVAYYTLSLSQPNGVIVTSGSEFLFEMFVFFPAVVILLVYSFGHDLYGLSREDSR